MALFRMGLPNAYPDRVPIIKDGMGKVNLTTLVYGVQQQLIEFIAVFMPKTNQIEWYWGRELKVGIRNNPRREILG